METITDPPGDTTTDPRWTPVKVTARLVTPPIGIDTHGVHLDGPVSYGAYQAHIAAHGHGALPPMTNTHAVDFALPFATWEQHGAWGWCCSRAFYDPAGYTKVDVRRKPETEAMARYASDRRHHLSAGPMKARDTPYPATLVGEVVWFALADPEPLKRLLDRVWSLGQLGRHGHGRVTEWEVALHDDREAWRDRVMPHPGGQVDGIRAPYHHGSRKVPAC